MPVEVSRWRMGKSFRISFTFRDMVEGTPLNTYIYIRVYWCTCFPNNREESCLSCPSSRQDEYVPSSMGTRGCDQAPSTHRSGRHSSGTVLPPAYCLLERQCLAPNRARVLCSFRDRNKLQLYRQPENHVRDQAPSCRRTVARAEFSITCAPRRCHLMQCEVVKSDSPRARFH